LRAKHFQLASQLDPFSLLAKELTKVGPTNLTGYLRAELLGDLLLLPLKALLGLSGLLEQQFLNF
jgi:hypothetical protein